MHKRNVEGLRLQAQARHQAALQRAEQGIARLLREEQPVNFMSVSKVAAVSTAWLYRQTAIRERIEYLRNQCKTDNMQPEKLGVKTGASEDSRKAILVTLRQHIKQLEAENRELKRQIEVAYGQIYKQPSPKQ
ncbi:MAG: hypothetical protein HXX08_17705 [Chloroflexi bacterium]|uniref:DUF6262 family protein n=1 Tax=Candidatus Chlorohelix allophototropha TaxID=3003348 RepID=A0A8T7M6V6_9CHLR|nr:hypothetical protein [Chloroflexota bacterium]WJW66129.1 DUF6262 family protein [Chloroflexota bacterium L227-S17]WJW69598.1 DUF6262 family protein [Chloroflexota bacterium L227-S17]